ncbi:MAG: lamin tail domain-containing protein [Anaerolineae bacterium]|nr:lamin tail domain-containing protein [Thermoflexales bacterium]MDW8408016.1 lamin tail domain-containing protein [Anaerolineae bacterium]
MATDSVLDIQNIPPDTCPICRQRALRFPAQSDTASLCVACVACGSRFTVDRATRRGQYTHLPKAFSARYPELSARLLSAPMTRREVFEWTAQVGRQPFPAPAEATASKSQAPGVVAWFVAIAAIMVAVVACALIAAFLVAPGVAQTRQIIAAARVSSTPFLSNPAPALEPLTSLHSPLRTPESGITLSSTEVGTNQGGPTAETPFAPPAQGPSSTPLVVAAAPATLPVSEQVIPSAAYTSAAPSEESRSSAPEQMPATPSGAEVPPPILPSPTSPSPTPLAANQNGAIAVLKLEYRGDPTIGEANEYVEIANQGGEPVDLSNWTLRAVSTNQVFTFPNGMIMFPGDACRIYTNSPVSFGACGTLAFGVNMPVWSNEGDVAELRDKNGALVTRWSYGMAAP